MRNRRRNTLIKNLARSVPFILVHNWGLKPGEALMVLSLAKEYIEDIACNRFDIEGVKKKTAAATAVR
jgi:hypothetical protein